jgi:lambda repressor-like predicted transcriptional regulator
MAETDEIGRPDPAAWIVVRLEHPKLWESLVNGGGGIHKFFADPVRLGHFQRDCHAICRALDLNVELPGLGLTVAKAHEAIVNAWVEQASFRQTHGETGWCPDMRQLVLNFHNRGLAEDRIDAVLDLPAKSAASIIREYPPHPGAKKVLRAHAQGLPVAEISRRSGVPESSVNRILESVGEVSNSKVRKQDAARRAATIRKLASQGATYKQISERLGVPMHTVDNALRRGRRKKGPAE